MASFVPVIGQTLTPPLKCRLWRLAAANLPRYRAHWIRSGKGSRQHMASTAVDHELQNKVFGYWSCRLQPAVGAPATSRHPHTILIWFAQQLVTTVSGAATALKGTGDA